MVTKTEIGHAAGFICSEAAGDRSREKETMLSGQNLKAGAALGKLFGTSLVAAADGGNTGNGVMGTVTGGVETQVGVYTLTCIAAATDAGTFKVETPSGELLEDMTVAVAYVNPQLNFTLADGSTDFAVGDKFTITVTGTDKVRALNMSGVDGSEDAYGFLIEDCDASAADKACAVLARDAEVNDGEITWTSGMTADQITAAKKQLRDNRNIHVR
jgi:hypothetical protein